MILKELLGLIEGYNTSKDNRELHDDFEEWKKAVRQAGGDFSQRNGTSRQYNGLWFATAHDGECGEFDEKTGEGWIVDKWSSKSVKEEDENIPKLTVKHGLLYARGAMLMDQGEDVETVSWPFKEGGFYSKEEWTKLLDKCLFGARETGDLPSKCTKVKLPDGTIFNITS